MLELCTRYLCNYQANLEPVQHDAGAAHFGRRMIAVVTGGSFSGPRLKGTVLPGGGDWALIEEARDVLRLDARVAWQTDDGVKIYVSYRGALRPLSEGVRQAEANGTVTEADRNVLYFRTLPIFECGDPRYQWLNDIVSVAIGWVLPHAVKYDVFEVL